MYACVYIYIYIYIYIIYNNTTITIRLYTNCILACLAWAGGGGEAAGTQDLCARLRRRQADNDNRTDNLLSDWFKQLLHLFVLQHLVNKQHMLLDCMFCDCYQFVSP